MSRRLSITGRRHDADPQSDEVAVVLMHISHPDFATPYRFSSDPTERLSIEPLLYGTRSRWRDSDPASAPFLFAAMSFQLPGDQDGAPAETRMTLHLYDAETVEVLRSVSTPARVDMAVVMASSPDLPEYEHLGHLLYSAGYDDVVTLTSSREMIEEEGVSKDRYDKDRFPGLHR
jgi:hypothetical protein